MQKRSLSWMRVATWPISAALAVGCVHQRASQPSSTATATITAAPPPVVSDVVTQDQQSAMTPDQAYARLVAGNQRFVSGNMLHRNYLAQVQATSTGQYPFAAVLCCIDSRTAPEIVFDQGIGDLFVARVAGNYASPDLIGSLEFATKVAGAKLIVVLGHTECGAIKGACDGVQLGNLTTVMHALQPAVDQAQGYDPRTSKNKKFVEAVTKANVVITIAKLREDSPILDDLVKSGQIKIVGGIYDISTGQVKWLDIAE